MEDQTLTLRIPNHLFQWLQHRAEGTHRPIEAEAIDLLRNATEARGVSAELQDLQEAMADLSDEELWDAAHNSLAQEATAALQRLRAKRKRAGLTLAEWQRRDDLLRQYDRGILIRSRALLLLKERGYDISALLEQL